jgi:DNA-binding transcriptional LysR family regulator
MKPTQHLPSLRQLHVFEAVARHKSIGRAAAFVSLSQPAVTQAIASLESRFGVTLFERGRRGSYLTDFGKILLARTERLFAFITQGLLGLLGSHQSSEPHDIDTLTGKITTTHIRCLIAVSENRSFDSAARSIGVSQPSLHRAARELERNLRRTIYYRGTRGITTTEQGAELARQFKLAMRELDYGSDEIAARQGIVTSRIAIGTGDVGPLAWHARSMRRRAAPACTVGNQAPPMPATSMSIRLSAPIGNRRHRDDAVRRAHVIVMRPKHPGRVYDISRDQLAVTTGSRPLLYLASNACSLPPETPNRAFRRLPRPHPFAHHHQRPLTLLRG